MKSHRQFLSRRRLPGAAALNDAAAALVALGTIVIIAALAAGVLRTVVPHYHVSFQTSGWQEARLAAEAGVDLAIERLNKNCPDPTRATADWVGWRQNATTAATGTYLSRANATARTGIIATGSTMVGSQPIFLDNVDVSPAAGLRAAADVQLYSLYPSTGAIANNVWFRIRSMGTASVPGPRRSAMDRMDTSLRRLSLRSPMRPTLAANDVLTATTIPYPNASRVIDVLVKPVRPFTKAIVTQQNLELGNASGWNINSYDSSDPEKSGTGGVYPGDESPKIQSNGDIASLQRNPDSAPYGPLIFANGAQVQGEVSTNGGDNPATHDAYENVSGISGIDPSRIHDDYDDPMTDPPAPPTSGFLTNPNYANNAPFAASGSSTTEHLYRIPANATPLGSLVVSGTGRISIVIEGDWDIGNGNGAFVQIPPGVQATIYVKGNIEFGNGVVNMNAASSKVPGNLIIYGVPDKVNGVYPARTMNSAGNPEIAAAFYGPSYRVTLSGYTEWYGSLVCHSYLINGGGSGGFHYDEALGMSGYIRKFVISSYYEDSRQ